MTTTDLDAPQPTEVLDLYDVLPPTAPVPAAREEDDPVTATIKGAGRNLAALIGLFAVHLAAFVICVTLFSAGAGLIVIFVGLFVLVAGLVVAGWSARLTRELLAYAGDRAAAARSTRPPDRACWASCVGWRTHSPGGTCCTCWSRSCCPPSPSRSR